MQTDVEGSGTVKVVPKVCPSRNETTHRKVHSPYAVSVVKDIITERGDAVEAYVSPQVRGIMRPPQNNGAKDRSVGSSDPKELPTTKEEQQPHHQQQQQSHLRHGYQGNGTGSEGVSSLLAGDDADVLYERVRDSIFNSASPDTVQDEGVAMSVARTKNPYAIPLFVAAEPGQSGGQEREQGPRDVSANQGHARGNDGNQLEDTSAASSMMSQAPVPLHHQHPKKENDAIDYLRYPRPMNLPHYHQHYQHHNYQQYSYESCPQRQMYDPDHGEREGYGPSSQKQRYFPFEAPPAHQQYSPNFQHLPQQPQQREHQYPPMQQPMYPPHHSDVQNWRADGASGYNVYSDPNNNNSRLTVGGDPRYRQGNTTLMHPQGNRNNDHMNNANSPLPAPQHLHQSRQQWPQAQEMHSIPNMGPNMPPGMTSQQVPSPYPGSGSGSYARYSSPSAPCHGVAPSPGMPYRGMGTNLELQSQPQLYPDDKQQPHGVPPVYHGNAPLPGSYNAGMYHRDYMDNTSCGQQSNPEASLFPLPLPLHQQHHSHHQHHHHQQWNCGGAPQQLPHPHLHPQQQQPPPVQPYPQESGYNMHHTHNGFSFPSFGPSGAPEGKIAVGHHSAPPPAAACFPPPEPGALRGRSHPQPPFPPPSPQPFPQPHPQAPPGGRSGAPPVGGPAPHRHHHHHGKQPPAGWGENSGRGRGGGRGHNRADHQQRARKANANESGRNTGKTPPPEVSANSSTEHQPKRNDVNITKDNAKVLGGGSDPNGVEKKEEIK